MMKEVIRGNMMESEQVTVRTEGCYSMQSSQGKPLGGNTEVRPQNDGGVSPMKHPGKGAQVEERAQNNMPLI